MSDISSDPCPTCGGSGKDRESSIGVSQLARMKPCSVCGGTGYARDISSVTGSEAQSFLADLGTDDEFVRRDRNAARIAAIQREAVDKALRRAYELGYIRNGYDLGHIIRNVIGKTDE